MKERLKNQKGFSMIELLVALLIMAVIAGIAITLYSGVLNSSKESADRATAAEIKRQLLIYMNASNDMDLSCVTTTDGVALVTAMTSGPIVIDDANAGKGTGDVDGSYGPYFEGSAPMPQAPNYIGWDIDVNSATMAVTVKAAKANNKVNVHT